MPRSLALLTAAATAARHRTTAGFNYNVWGGVKGDSTGLDVGSTRCRGSPECGLICADCLCAANLYGGSSSGLFVWKAENAAARTVFSEYRNCVLGKLSDSWCIKSKVPYFPH